MRFGVLAAIAVLSLSTHNAEARCHTHACWHRVHVHRVEQLVERRIARITPYRCYGDRFAIPCFYIGHESATSGLWTAENAEGCIGAYQFCGWHVPWPVIVASKLQTLKNKLAHDRLARIRYAADRAGRECNWCY